MPIRREICSAPQYSTITRASSRGGGQRGQLSGVRAQKPAPNGGGQADSPYIRTVSVRLRRGMNSPPPAGADSAADKCPRTGGQSVRSRECPPSAVALLRLSLLTEPAQ